MPAMMPPRLPGELDPVSGRPIGSATQPVPMNGPLPLSALKLMERLAIRRGNGGIPERGIPGPTPPKAATPQPKGVQSPVASKPKPKSEKEMEDDDEDEFEEREAPERKPQVRKMRFQEDTSRIGGRSARVARGLRQTLGRKM